MVVYQEVNVRHFEHWCKDLNTFSLYWYDKSPFFQVILLSAK